MRGSTAGLAEGVIKPSKNVHETFLDILDCLFVSFIITPLVLLYWRGTWNLMGIVLEPFSEMARAYCSLLIGIIGHLFFTMFQDNFKKTFHPDKHRMTYYLFSRFYTMIYGIVCVNGWCGGWFLIDHYAGYDLKLCIGLTLGAVIALSLLKALRNISSVPFGINIDQLDGYFRCPTMFKKSGQNEPGLYVLDCLFSVLVIGTLVVFVWRGFWVFLDLQLFPGNDRENHIKSAWGSTVIGYGIVAVTFALQPFMRAACDRLEGIWRVAAADIFLILSFIGTVNVWRGVWKLIDLFFMPDDWLLNNLITHAVGFILLALLNCSNSVLVRGVYIDAEEPAGQCVVFPIYYIRFFFQKERTKKQRKLLEALDSAAADANTELLTKKNSTNANNSTPITLVASKNLINVSNMSKEMTFTEITESSEKLSKIEYDNEKKSDEDYDS